MKAPAKYLAIAVAFEGNYTARGSVTLKSADPKDPPVIDPKFLAEPFDRRVAIEAVREGLRFLDLPQIAKDQVRLAAGPEDRSDEAILVRSYSQNLTVCQVDNTHGAVCSAELYP